MAQREAVAHLPVEIQELLLYGAQARGRGERLGQRGEREPRVGADRVAGDARETGVGLVEHARAIDDRGGDGRDGAGVHPGASEVEWRAHRARP